VGIPYETIGIGLGFLLGVWAFIVADSVKGRVFIVIAMALIFFFPVLWRRPASHMVSFIGWIIFGLGCVIFLKLRGVGIR
jgi:hypothetical protein